MKALTRFAQSPLSGILALAATVTQTDDLRAQITPVTITGHIRDRAGAGAAGAAVEVSVSSATGARAAKRTTTASDGSYSVEIADTGSIYRLYVSGATWIPDGTTCRRAPLALRVTCDLVIRPTQPVFTSAPIEPRPVVVERAKLGIADAIEITGPRGRIFVAGSWDDSTHVGYQLRRDIAGPRRDSMLVIPPYEGKLDLTFGANGMLLRVNAADLPGGDGVDIRLTVPRSPQVDQAHHAAGR